MMLILDLDDTLFATKSMDPALFDPARKIIEAYTIPRFGKRKSEAVITELWNQPFDIVANQYDFPADLRTAFYQKLQSTSYQLKIEVFTDYPALKALPYKKHLVTTGITNLQQAKIAALGIKTDFQSVRIDDPFDPDRQSKKELFRSIRDGEEAEPESIWIIGDNPDAELKAGKELGCRTVQRLNGSKEKSEFADFTIHSFEELKEIIN